MNTNMTHVRGMQEIVFLTYFSGTFMTWYFAFVHILGLTSQPENALKKEPGLLGFKKKRNKDATGQIRTHGV